MDLNQGTPARQTGRFGTTERWRRELYVVMFAVFAAFTGFTFVMPFLPIYVAQLGATDPGEAALWSGAVFGITPLLWGLLAPFWQRLAARFGYRRMMQFALIMFAIVLSGMAFVTSVQQLFILRALLGVFGGFAVLSMALASAIAPRERVGEATGLLQASQLACGIGAPFLGGVVVDAIGIHRSFFGAAALSVIGYLLITFGLGEKRAATGVPTAARTVAATRAYFRLPAFTGLLATVVALQFIDRSFGPLMPLYIATLDPPAGRIGMITGLVMMVGALAGSVAAWYTGRLSARRAPRPLLLLTLGAGAVCCIPIAFVSGWGQLLALRFLLGLLAGGALTLAFAVGGRALPDAVRPAAFGALAGAGQLGAAVSPVAAGILARGASLGAIFLLDAALYAIVLLWAWRALPRANDDARDERAIPSATSRAALAAD
jgi:DHA1 family multidrug resistance protein-like MFS transporter